MKKILSVIFILFLTTLSMKADELYCWGSNGSGEVGDGTTINRTSPTQIGTGIDWKSVSCGFDFKVAIKTDGTLWAWGNNSSGQLGDGTLTDRNTPTQIGTSTDWKLVFSGVDHTLAIKTDGSLWAWGNNSSGELGDGTTISRNAPVQIGLAYDWKDISCGINFSVALKIDGTLWAWGYNGYGQIGDGTNINRRSPVQVGLDADWLKVVCGAYHTIGLKTDAILWAWGNNEEGQLGDGTTINKNTPTLIGTDDDWEVLSCGRVHTTALKSDGTLWTWGDNSYMQLGDGTTTNKNTPTLIGTDDDWVTVVCGAIHTLAIKDDGTLWAWGENASGALGDGTTIDRNSPTQIGTDVDWDDIFASRGYHSVGLKYIDNTPPTAMCKNITIELDEFGSASITAEDVDDGSYDESGIKSLEIDITSFDCSNIGDNTVILTVTDEYDNVSTCQATVTVEDLIAPEITYQEEDRTAIADLSCQAEVPDFMSGSEAIDNCGDIYWEQYPEPETFLELGHHEIMVTAWDNSNNSTSYFISFDVEDHTPPEIIGVTKGRRISANENCEAEVPDFIDDSRAYDNCSEVTWTQIPPAGSFLEGGKHIILLIARDDYGNESSYETQLNIEDRTPPEIISHIEYASDFADNDCQARVPNFRYSSEVVDNCSEVTWSQEPEPGTMVGLGQHTINVNVRDENKNQNSFEVIFEVIDNTPPEIITMEEDQTAFADENCEAAVPNFYDGSVAIDNCSEVIWSQVPAPETMVGLGVHNVRVKAKDASNVESFFDVTFTVTDNTAPEFITQEGDQTASADENCEAAVPDFMDESEAIDNCSELTWSQEPEPGTLVGLGQHEIKVKVKDASNVQSFFDVYFVVEDDTPPSISISVDPSVFWPPDNKMKSISATVVAEDNCEDVTYVLTSITSNEDISNDVSDAAYNSDDLSFNLRASRDGSGSGRTYTIKYTATDAAGNTSLAEATVTVPHDQAKLSLLNNVAFFNIYPNPAEDYIRIEAAFADKVDVQIRLADILGKEIINLERNGVSILNDKLDLSKLAQGIYIIELRIGNEIVRRQFVKQ